MYLAYVREKFLGAAPSSNKSVWAGIENVKISDQYGITY